MDDKWPERPTLRSPFNHNKCAGAEPGLQPDTSPAAIQQIANAMGSNEPVNQGDQCSQMLNSMPDFPEMDPPSPAAPAYLSDQPQEKIQNDELGKLLKGGYRPLDKINGDWTETSEGGGKLIVEDIEG